MASIVLSTVGASLGSAVGGSFGGYLAGALGRAVGGMVDTAVFGSGALAGVEGPRLNDLAVQTSTYGRMVPLVYGTVRIAGNVIWSRPIRERITTTTQSGGGKGGGGVTQTTKTYSYTVTLAIAICEGPIDAVLRVWADALQLDMSQGTYRIYKGTEAQMPDSAIIATQGVGNAPAYRGMAYVVVEDFPLGEFGNRIPNFTFEVRKKSQDNDVSGGSLESMVRGVNLIPGAGEFVYDTDVQYKLYGRQVEGNWIQQGSREPLNMHNPEGRANALLAIDHLEETLPNLEWVSVIITWFGTSLDAGDCKILPGVEYKSGSTTSPDIWQVGAYSRGTAHGITLIDGVPRYGGTPDDGSILRLVNNLKARGLKVMCYPMFFMDVDGKPWRGHVSGTAGEVASFFTKTEGYNQFILHYANLLANKVDAFCIGSELIGLTKVSSSAGVYPAVTALVGLAAQVRTVMGSTTKLTYAADWSEYHHTDGGWYNLDPLWASSNIDMVGIDAYFPLTDAVQQGYDVELAREGWSSGEGYDWYYSDEERTVKAPLGAAYAWKNIRWWWENVHLNPGGGQTAWVPESKKIWFTEYGFPSVDGATNQPNVFFDPDTSESGFPRFSRGRVDFRAQRVGLMATEQEWHGSDMVERMFIWAWDARPFPYWPDLTEIWADGGAWRMGHWVQGKLGISGLASVVADVCSRAGLDSAMVDSTRLSQLLEGCVISSPSSARQVLEQLMTGFFFDAVESDGVLKFVPRGSGVAATIVGENLLPMGEEGVGNTLIIRRQQEVELPRQVNVLYINRSSNYMQGNQFSSRQVTSSDQSKTISLPIVFSDQGAKVLADQLLYSAWVERTTYECHLPIAYAALEPTDVITVQNGGTSHQIRITEVVQSKPGIVRVRGTAEDVAVYDVYLPPAETESRVVQNLPLSQTETHLLDLPAFPEDGGQGILRIAFASLDAGWKGAVLYRSDDGGEEYNWVAGTDTAAIIGSVTDGLPAGKTGVMDEVNTLEVVLLGDQELSSVTFSALVNGANTCVLGDEVLQFQNAELLEEGSYRLSGLLRARLGTEHAMGAHYAGEKCFFLSGAIQRVNIPTSLIGLPRLYKGVSVGATLDGAEAHRFIFSGRAFRPYSPVHLKAEYHENGDIALNWVRRARGGGEWRDYVDVPLGEAYERYEVEVLSGPVVKRTIRITSPEALYTAAQQIVDFGALQTNVQIRVYQISDILGRGYPAHAFL